MDELTKRKISETMKRQCNRRKKISEELSRTEFIRLYRQEHKSLEDIAMRCNCTRSHIMKLGKKYGIIRRSRSEARLEALKQNKLPYEYADINKDFFSHWSNGMAYVLGLIITDGCIHKSRRGTYQVSLSMNDRSLIDKVRNLMKSTHKIIPSKHQRGLYLFNFAREKISKDLLKLGVTPNKSRTVRFPDVPDNYLRHFIRGVFDGDGCVFLDPKGKRERIRTSFTSGSKDFIVKLEEKLRSLGMSKRNVYIHKAEKNDSYLFKYSHKNSVKLFTILYKDVNKNMYLERKYEKFKEGLKYIPKPRKWDVATPSQEEIRKLKELCRSGSCRMVDLAEMFEVNRKTIHRWLYGKFRPRNRRLLKIKTYLKEMRV